MQQTAAGVFKIIDRASDPIKKIMGAAKGGDEAVDRMGKKLDELDSPKIRTSISNTQRDVSGLGRTAETAGKLVESSTDRAGRGFEKMAAKGKASIEELQMALRRFEHERATATLDVNISKAEAKIRLLKEQIRSVQTTEARKELDAMGLTVENLAGKLGSGMGGGGGGSPGRGAGTLAGGFFAAGGRALFMAGALALALPAIVALTGAVSALVGSAGAAAAGAGALGVGVFAPLVVGIGAIVSVAKPAINGLKEVKKAQDAYTKSVQMYGDKSSQAIRAHRALVAAQQKDPGAGAVIRDSHVLSQRWKQATAPGRQQFYGIMDEGIGTANDLLPEFSGIANNALTAAHRAVAQLRQDFTGDDWRGIFQDMGDLFDRLIGPGSHALEEVARFFGHIAQSASPMVVQMFDSADRWATNLANRSSNLNRTQTVVASMVDQLKAWVHLFGAAGRLAVAFFGAGARQGEDAVKGITARLNEWTDWIHNHPAAMTSFFDRTIDSAHKLIDALGQIGRVLGHIGDTMLPLMNMLSSFLSAAGGSGMIGPLTTFASFAFLQRRRIMNDFRGRGMGPGGAPGGPAMVPIGMGGPGGGPGNPRGPGMFRRGFDQYQLNRNPALAARYATTPMGRFGALRSGVGAATSGLGGRIVGGIGGGASYLARNFLAPMVGFGALAGLTQGSGGAGFAGSFRNLTSGMFGAIGLHPFQNQAEVNQEKVKQDLTAMQGNVPVGHTIGAVNAQLHYFQRTLKRVNDSTSATDVEKSTVTKVIEAEISQRKNLLPLLRDERRARQRQSASAYIASTQQAYQIDLKASGPQAAYQHLVQNIEAGLKGRKGPGAKLIAQDGLDMVREAAKNNPKLMQQYKALADDVQKRFDDVGSHVDKVNGNIYSGSDREWKKIREAIAQPAEVARQRTTTAFTQIQEAAIGSLMGMGYSRAQAQKMISSVDATGKAPGGVSTSTSQAATNKQTGYNAFGFNTGAGNNLNAQNPFKARGGRIGGVGTADSVALGGYHVAPGELVVNQHTERRADQKLGFPGALAMLVNGEKIPHGMYANFAFGGRFATGGGFGAEAALRSGLVPGHPELHPGISRMAEIVLSRFPGLAITSTNTGGHVAGSYHYKGEAVDIAGGVPLMNTAAAWIGHNVGKSLTEGIHNPNLSIKYGKPVDPSYWGSSIWAGHANHIHLAVAGALGDLKGVASTGAGPMTPTQHLNLKRRRSGLPGWPGLLADSAILGYTSGLERHVNKKLAAAGGAGGGAGAGVTSATRLSRKAVENYWVKGGGPPGLAHTMANIAWGESRWNPNAENPLAVNGLHAQGLWQILGKPFPGNAFDPLVNARMAVSKWKSGGLHPWDASAGVWSQRNNAPAMAFGGRMGNAIPWFGAGGSFTAHRPTVIGVGDRQAERVKVEPISNPNASPVQPKIEVNIEKIVNYEEGDIEKILERELAKVGVRLINSTPGGEGELHG